MTNQTQSKSFILHKDSLSVLNKLTDEQAGKLFKSIFAYQAQNILPNDELTSIIFEPFLNQFKRDVENYKKTCEARKIAGSKGGKQKVANASKSKQKVANLADSDSKNKNESKNENKNEIKLNENNIYKELSNNLQFILEEKLQRKLSSRNWDEEIKKLIEKDLSVRPNPIEDVKRAIQTIADNYGKNYFPVIQSGSALREKFTKIEDFVKRNTATQIPQTNSVSSSFDEKKKFYLENRNRIHPNLNEINDILNKIDNNQSKTQIIAYKAKTAFFVSNNANANLDLDEKLEKYFDLIVVLDYKTKEKYES